jgi:hypothetical protein
LRTTPLDTNRIEFTVIDTRVVGRQRGGGLGIPQNGLVLSFAASALPPGALPEPGDELPRVRYDFLHEAHRAIQEAIQAGPSLLKDGHVTLTSRSLAAEQFWPTPLGTTGAEGAGIVPSDYPMDVDRTRAGRIGIGVDNAGHLVVVVVPGTERGALRPGLDSAGATLVELADLLAAAGAVDAVNLDGGGSTQLFWLGGLATTPGNRYRRPGLRYERMVPSIGVLF